MKNNKFLKITFVILTLALVLGAVLAMTVSANGETKPEIISQNLKYGEKFQLMYAVDTDTVAAGPVTLRVYTVDPDETPNAQPIAEMTVSEPTTDSEELGNLTVDSAYIFTTTAGVSYTEMATNYYAQATDSADKKSDVKRYSVAEYFYQRLATVGVESAKQDMYSAALDFGTTVQIALNKMSATDANLISNLRYVVADGGKFDGKYNTALYPTGTVVVPSAAGVTTWNVAVYDTTGAATVTNKVPSFAIPTTEGITKILFTTGNIITYRNGTNNLDNATDLASVNMGYKTWYSTITGSLVTESGRGQVVKFDFSGANSSYAFLNINNNIVSGSNATAFEASFDIKATTSGQAAGTDKYEYFELQLLDGETAIYRLNIYTYRNGTDANLVIRDSSKGDIPGGTISGVKATEWYNIRIVVYKNNPNLYVYVNGSDEALVVESKYLQSSSANFNGTLSDSFNIALLTRETVPVTIKLDNVFVGYTEDSLTGN